MCTDRCKEYMLLIIIYIYLFTLQTRLNMRSCVLCVVLTQELKFTLAEFAARFFMNCA